MDLSNNIKPRQNTCWAFKWKIQRAMQISWKYPLIGEVHPDEFAIGGPEEQKRGRFRGSKNIVIVALKIFEKGIGSVYAQVFGDYSLKSVIPFFEKYISKEAVVKTDERIGYKPLKKDYPNLEQTPTFSDKVFPDVYVYIMNIKGCFRGIHYHCRKKHLKGYLDQYHCRFNQRNTEVVLFNTLIKTNYITTRYSNKYYQIKRCQNAYTYYLI